MSRKLERQIKRAQAARPGNGLDIIAVKAEWSDVARLMRRAQARLDELEAVIQQHEQAGRAAPPPPPPPAAPEPSGE